MFLAAFALFLSPVFAVQSANITVDTNISADTLGNLLNITANASHATLGEVNATTGFANYTIYNSTGSVALGPNLPMSFNGTDWINTSIDISGLPLGDYYVKVNATYTTTSEWNWSFATKYFAVGAITKTRNNENYQNASTTVLNYTSMHGTETVDNTKGNMSYGVIGQAISGSLPWDGNFWTDIIDFSALGVNSYTLQINATHYTLLNSTNYPFSISNYSGFVEDAFAVASNNDLDAAQVALTQSGNAIATTGSNGFYSMKIMHIGTLTPTMQAIKTGFVANTTNDYSNILLSGNSTLNGTVTELGEGHISGASVSVYDNTTDVLMYQTTTDSNGHYSITVRGDKAYYVNCTAAGFPEKTENNAGAGFVGINTVDSSMVADGFAYYNITIKDSANTRPMPNVTITLYTTVYENTKTTDANGNAIIKVWGSGILDSVNYYANISHPDYENKYEIEFGEDINNGETKTKDFTLSGATYFTGYVLDEYNNKAVVGVGVNLTIVDGSSLLGYGEYYYNTTTNSGGWFRIDIPTSLLNLDSALNFTLSGYSLKNIPVYGNTSQSWTGDDVVKLRGTSKVEGKVVDKENTSYALSGIKAVITMNGNSEYEAITNDTGDFVVYVVGSTNFTITIDMDLMGDITGYYPYQNNTVFNSSINYGVIELTGLGVLFGEVYDNQNNSIKVNNAKILITSPDGLAYLKYTDSNGAYSLNIALFKTYTITVEKDGYALQTRNIGYADDPVLDEESLGIVGKNNLYIYSFDATGEYAIDDTKVTVKDTLHNTIYSDITNYGTVLVNIPSTASYTVTFEKDGYITLIGCDGSTCGGPYSGATFIYYNLTGATHIEGSVMDEYNQIHLEGVQVFFNDLAATKIYITTTDSDGKYAIDVGFDSNYEITYSKSGYNTLEDTFYGGGYPYDFGNLGNNDLIGKTTYLRGSTIVNVTVLDEFTQTPVIGAAITIKPEIGTSYSSNADIYGNSIIYIGGAIGIYNIEMASYGYPIKTIANLAGSQIRTEELSATAKVRVSDIMASEAYKNITGSSITLFYHYKTTSFNYTLNETIVGVKAGCEGTQRDNITIELTGTNVSYYDQKQLTSGYDAVTFNKVPVGGYSITINNTEYGCGFDVQSIVIPEGGTTYNYTYDINKTEARFGVENLGGSDISGAIISLSTDSSVNCTTDVAGTCTIDFMSQGTKVFDVAHPNHNGETVTKSISFGMLNDFTAVPVVLKPYYGNLTVFVRNTTLEGIQNVNIIVSNESSTTSLLTDANGYANFTGMVSFQNITIDATAEGYSRDTTDNFYVNPNSTSFEYITVNPTTLTITVLNASAINDSNVTLWNGTDIAQNANKSVLTGRTNASGQITFSYVKAGDYNLTINKTNYSYFVAENVNYGFANRVMDATYYLNETYIDVFVIDPEGNPLSGINVSINTTGFPSAITDANGFMSTRIIGTLSEGMSINVTVNGTTTGYDYTNVTAYSTINGSNPQLVTLYP
ncbi:MAG: carboxypeptidase regulatory-like domain-containing protein, partial [Candidatus Aenigmarchaeota archaeon]|nr:carboxypeptidase regulatory-like domain-containing protein [Candidatus Aenigmarchaeota archaeon]